MKIAFCISGHLRNYKSLAKNFFAFKQHYAQYGDIDIYVCSWNKLNASKSWSAAHNLNSLGSADTLVDIEAIKNFYQTNYVQLLNDDFFSSIYSPFNYTDMTDHQYNYDNRAMHNNVPYCVKQLGLIYYCNIMKKHTEYKNNRLYDFVFRLRPDMQYYLNNLVDLNSLLNSCNIYTSYYPEKGRMGDIIRFAFGGSSIMNKYANSYLRVSHFFDQDIFGDAEKLSYLCISQLIGETNIVFLPEIGRLVAENNPNDLR